MCVCVIECIAACRSLTNFLQIVYGGSVLSDTATLASMGYSSSKSLVVTTPPAPVAPSPTSPASINASIDAAYSASLAADAALQSP